MNTAFDCPGSDRIAGETSSIVDVEFIHQLLSMFLDGFDADPQMIGDLFVGFPSLLYPFRDMDRFVIRHDFVIDGKESGRCETVAAVV